MRQRHVPTATGMQATIEELLEAVFSMQPAPKLHKESILSIRRHPARQAGRFSL
jgi:hypothetical protein